MMSVDDVIEAHVAALKSGWWMIFSLFDHRANAALFNPMFKFGIYDTLVS